MNESGKAKQPEKVKFEELYLGDRFTAHDALWTKIDWHIARKHSKESRALRNDGFGYLGDTIVTFDRAEEVVFEAPTN
jgi:hypothetical protein